MEAGGLFTASVLFSTFIPDNFASKEIKVKSHLSARNAMI